MNVGDGGLDFSDMVVDEAQPSQTPTLSEAQSALLNWYRTYGRDLPWRHTKDPYHVLVAEVMLQQTQVDRVVPKYLEFLEAFPTVQDLAAAPRGEVIRRWAPLGYNLRAVRLQQVAQQVAEGWGGVFPEDETSLLALKGIGPYTAGAIQCFAFRRPSVFLDTNLRRVIGRCFAGLGHPRPESDKELLRIAREVLPEGQAYEWHQALMDLGATVCAWSRPRCLVCPLVAHCRARSVLGGSEGGAVAEPRPVYRTQPRFWGSSRYYRGRAVSLLRALPPGETVAPEALARQVWSEGMPEEAALWALLDGLERDGLITRDASGGISLP